jgi:hypothetical protein
MKISRSVYGEKILYAFLKAVFVPSLRPAFFKCVKSIFYNFFFRQFRAAFLPGRIPVSQVDHQLDEKIPFVPRWVTIYLDFVYFWIRMLSFFLRRYKRKAYIPVRDFIFSIGRLYAFAAEVYSKNLSTTKRPFYIKRPRFLLIHLADPHLMCIPSLHVMAAVHTYTMFGVMADKIGEAHNLKEQILEMRQGALAICQAILFVKQHSVNCIPTALYAMTCFNPEIFTIEEAVSFTGQLFFPPPSKENETAKYKTHPCAAPFTDIPKADQVVIKNHILFLYRRFLEEKKTARTWDEPLLKFLESM